ncbi:MAG: glycosyltransferase family 2 protein [Candidatus Paceibacterota bacterium]|jgi:glycosyltransferase involved in cell wall biosynthesis
MSSPKISLIIPAFNEEKYIGPCLEYALKCSSEGKLYEIIVVDNKSTDHTKKIAESFVGVKVVSEQEKGVTRARQRGYKESKGDILAFIDADTRMEKGWIEKIVKEFSQDPHLACLSGPYTYYDISVFRSKLYWWTMWVPSYIVSIFTRHMSVAGNTAIRRDVLDKMSGMNTSIEFYGDDTDTAVRASRYGKVKFSLGFSIPTSARRIEQQGALKTSFIYAVNYVSTFFFGKPVTKGYVEIR